MTREERQRKVRALRRRRPRPSIRAIAAAVGCSPGTVQRDLDPEAEARYRENERQWLREKRSTQREEKAA